MIEKEEKFVIISDYAGSGKSTVLPSIAKQIKHKNKNQVWVERIILNDFAIEKEEEHSLHNLKNIKTPGDAIKSISRMIIREGLDREIQRGIFENGLKGKLTSLKFFLFFDGFDEINKDFQGFVLNLLEKLESLRGVKKIWVTTRQNDEENLKKGLRVEPFKFCPLEIEEQQTMLTKYWKWCVKFDKDSYNYKNLENPYKERSREEKAQKKKEIGSVKFDQVASDLIDIWSKTVFDVNQAFLDLPLQLRMLAEVMFERNLKIMKRLNLLELFEAFVDIKFEILRRQKAKSFDNKVNEFAIDNFLMKSFKIHARLAVNQLFALENRNKPPNLPGLGKIRKLKSPRKINELVTIGLLYANKGKLRFVHLSFAEYLLNKYLIQNLQDKEVQKNLLGDIFMGPPLYLTRKLFNEELDNFYQKFKDPDPDDTKTFFKQIKIQKTPNIEMFLVSLSTYSMLTTAGQENNTFIVKFIIDQLKQETTILQDTLKGGAHFYPRSPIFETGYWNNVETLKTFFEEMMNDEIFGKEKLRNLLLSDDYDNKSFLHKLCSRKAAGTIEFLLTFFETHFDMEAILELFRINYLGGSPFHEVYTVVDFDPCENFQVLFKFIQRKFDDQTMQGLFKPDLEKGRNPLMYSIEREHFKTMQALLDFADGKYEIAHSLLISRDKEGKNSLHLIAECSNSQAVQRLLRFIEKNLSEDQTQIKELFNPDNKGRRCLHIQNCKCELRKFVKFSSTPIKIGATQHLLPFIEKYFSKDEIERDFFVADEDGENPLHCWATCYYDPESLKNFLEFGKENVENFKGLFGAEFHNQNPLQISASKAPFENFKVLLEFIFENYGAKFLFDLMDGDEKGQSLLFLTVQTKVLSKTKVLLDFLLSLTVEDPNMSNLTGFDQNNQKSSIGLTAPVNNLTASVNDLTDSIKSLTGIVNNLTRTVNDLTENELNSKILIQFKCNNEDQSAIFLSIKNQELDTLTAILKFLNKRFDNSTIRNLVENDMTGARALLRSLWKINDGEPTENVSTIIEFLEKIFLKEELESIGNIKEWKDLVQITLKNSNPNLLELVINFMQKYFKSFNKLWEPSILLIDQVYSHPMKLNFLLKFIEENKIENQFEVKDNQSTPVYAAIPHGNLKCFDILLEFLSTNYEFELEKYFQVVNNQTPIHEAVKIGNEMIFESLWVFMETNLPRLLQQMLENYGKEFLVLASSNKNSKVIESLLKRFNKVQSKIFFETMQADQEGQSIIHKASMKAIPVNLEKIIEFIHKNYGLKTLKELLSLDKELNTPIHYASERLDQGGNLKVLLNYIEENFDEKTVLSQFKANRQGLNPLHYAATTQYSKENIQLLLKFIKDYDEIESLRLILFQENDSHQNLIEILAQKSDKRTLQTVIEFVEEIFGLETVWKLFFNEGKLINVLHYAAMNDDEESRVLEYLMEFVHSKFNLLEKLMIFDENNKSVIDYIIINGHSHVLEYFQEFLEKNKFNHILTKLLNPPAKGENVFHRIAQRFLDFSKYKPKKMLEIFQNLVDYYMNKINQKNFLSAALVESSQTPLHIALISKDPDLIKYFHHLYSSL